MKAIGKKKITMKKGNRRLLIDAFSGLLCIMPLFSSENEWKEDKEQGACHKYKNKDKFAVDTFFEQIDGNEKPRNMFRFVYRVKREREKQNGKEVKHHKKATNDNVPEHFVREKGFQHIRTFVFRVIFHYLVNTFCLRKRRR